MATVKNMPPDVANQFDTRFVIWIHQYIVNILNAVGVDVTSLEDGVSTLGTSVESVSSEVTEKADANHNHNLNDLTEKSYNSLDDKPSIPDIEEADVVSDGPTAVAVSAVSCPTGADTIDRSSFNTTLSTLVTEINNLKDDINDLTTVHDDLIDKLQAAGLMGT